MNGKRRSEFIYRVKRGVCTHPYDTDQKAESELQFLMNCLIHEYSVLKICFSLSDRLRYFKFIRYIVALWGNSGLVCITLKLGFDCWVHGIVSCETESLKVNFCLNLQTDRYYTVKLVVISAVLCQRENNLQVQPAKSCLISWVIEPIHWQYLKLIFHILCSWLVWRFWIEGGIKSLPQKLDINYLDEHYLIKLRSRQRLSNGFENY